MIIPEDSLAPVIPQTEETPKFFSVTHQISLKRKGSFYRWRRGDGEWVSPLFTSLIAALAFRDFRTDEEIEAWHRYDRKEIPDPLDCEVVSDMVPPDAPGAPEHDWMPEAEEEARHLSQISCPDNPFDELTHKNVSRVIANWMSTAAQHLRNEQYYRGLLVQCGEIIGKQAYLCDDGTESEEVLVAKIPKLVKIADKQIKERTRFYEEVEVLRNRAREAVRILEGE